MKQKLFVANHNFVSLVFLCLNPTPFQNSVQLIPLREKKFPVRVTSTNIYTGIYNFLSMDTRVMNLENKVKPFLTLSEIFCRNGSRSCSGTCKKRLGCMSAAQNVKISMAVKRVCFRDGTNTITGFFGECRKMAW